MNNQMTTKVPPENMPPTYTNTGPVPPYMGNAPPPPPMASAPPPPNMMYPNQSFQTRMSEAPMRMVCPICHAEIITTTEYVPGVLPWLVCLAMLCLGFSCGCCVIPFCINSFKDVYHYCPNCNSKLGCYNRLS